LIAKRQQQQLQQGLVNVERVVTRRRLRAVRARRVLRLNRS
jgi:hypothetical protein